MKRNFEMVALCVLTEPTLTAAAEKAGISERTLRRYQKTPEYQAAYQTIRKVRFTETMEKAQAITLDALNTLHQISRNPALNESARVSAARAILEFGTQLHSIESIEEELAALKERITDETD